VELVSIYVHVMLLLVVCVCVMRICVSVCVMRMCSFFLGRRRKIDQFSSTQVEEVGVEV